MRYSRSSRRRWVSFSTTTWSRHSRRRVPMSRSIGRTLARYPLRGGPVSSIPFQTVRAHFRHTAYRWSLGVRHARGQGMDRPEQPMETKPPKPVGRPPSDPCVPVPQTVAPSQEQPEPIAHVVIDLGELPGGLSGTKVVPPPPQHGMQPGALPPFRAHMTPSDSPARAPRNFGFRPYILGPHRCWWTWRGLKPSPSTLSLHAAAFNPGVSTGSHPRLIPRRSLARSSPVLDDVGVE
jgi:hypothetical protein